MEFEDTILPTDAVVEFPTFYLSGCPDTMGTLAVYVNMDGEVYRVGGCVTPHYPTPGGGQDSLCWCEFPFTQTRPGVYVVVDEGPLTTQLEIAATNDVTVSYTLSGGMSVHDMDTLIVWALLCCVFVWLLLPNF